MINTVRSPILLSLLLVGMNAQAEDAGCLQERAARILASVYESGNPEDSPFNHTGEKPPTLLRDIVNDNKTVIVTLEHSIIEEEEKPVVLKGYAEITAWLSQLHAPDEHGYIYGIEVRTLGGCVNGCCEFPFIHGISHNTLYLEKVCFGNTDGIPYLSEVHLYDGD